MKKVKIMLLSLALFAIVGGALAFKSKYTSRYCVSITIDNNGIPTCSHTPGIAQICLLMSNVKTTDEGLGVRFCTTSVNGSNNCSGQTTCTTLINLIDDN